jgi:hypothetical protein
MPPNEPPTPSPEQGWPEWLKPGRWLQFARRLLSVESALEQLRSDNSALAKRVIELEIELRRLQAIVDVLTATQANIIDDKVRIAVLETVPQLVDAELKRRRFHADE